MPRYADDDNRPRRTSGKATASLVCGLIAFCLPCLPAIPGIILGVLGLRDINQSRGRIGGQALALTGIVTSALSGVLWVVFIPILVGLLLPAVQKLREAAVKVNSANNLKSIGVAMLRDFLIRAPSARTVRRSPPMVGAGARGGGVRGSGAHGRRPKCPALYTILCTAIEKVSMLTYHDRYNTFPAPAIRNRQGKPLLSWRVALLPYLNEQALYNEFHLDEPWDSPHNKALLPRMPRVYRSPHKSEGATTTPYQVFVGRRGSQPRPVFVQDDRSASLSMITNNDGTRDTLLAVEAADEIPWTKPDDLPYAPNRPLPRLGGITSRGFNALFADGSVRYVKKETSEQVLRNLITYNDNNVIPPDQVP